MSTTDLAINALLASLPAAAFYEFRMQATVVQLNQGTILYENGAEVDEVYFPLSGGISLVFVMKTGKTIEIGTIDRDGVFGAMAGLGIYTSHTRAIVAIPSVMARMTAPNFRRLAGKHEAIINLIIRSNEAMLHEALVNAACNASHRIENRLASWLLKTSDRAATPVIGLTQDSLAQILGVRRTSVTEVAGNFQDAGLIKYSRGAITILDHKGLEGVACECFQSFPTKHQSSYPMIIGGRER